MAIRTSVLEAEMENWVDPSRIAIVLPRVSTKQQVGNYSWKDQLDLAELARKDGFISVEIMEEAGVSGEDLTKRPVLQRVLQRIESGNVGALYLLNWSRGSRDEDLTDGRKIVQVCRQHHTIIRMPEAVYDFDREDDENFADIGFLIGKWQKRAIIKAMSRGEYKRASEGKYVGQRPRFGYKFKYELVESSRGMKKNTDWQIDEEEAKVIRFIHEKFPRYSTRKWAAILNRLAKWGRVMYYPVKGKKDQERTGRKEREWEQSDITTIINNQMLIGRIRYAAYDARAYRNGRRQPSRHLKGLPPISVLREDLRIIDDATFERNQHIMKERSTKPSRTFATSHSFAGVLRCPYCGGAMYGHGGKKKEYICSNYQKKGRSVCRAYCLHEFSVRDIVLPLLVDLLQPNIGSAITEVKRRHDQERQKEKEEPSRKISQLKNDIERINSELENLMGYARHGAITAEQLKKENLKLLDEMARKQAQIWRLERSDLGSGDHNGNGLGIAAMEQVEDRLMGKFTDQFLKDLPEFMQYLYEQKKTVFNQVLRMVFATVVVNSDYHGPRHWKKGLRLTKYGQQSPRPCYLQDYDLEESFREWIEECGFTLPDKRYDTADGYEQIGRMEERDRGEVRHGDDKTSIGKELARRSLLIHSGNNDGGRERGRVERGRHDELFFREGETFLDRLAEVFQVGLEKADLTSLRK
jgi:site-specific DNA recombinase